MAAPWLLFLLTFLTIACFSLSSKPNAINVTNTPASSFGDDHDPLAAASRTRSRHLNSFITSILKADAKWLFLKIFGKNEIPKVNLYKAEPPRFKFRKPDPKRTGNRFKVQTQKARRILSNQNPSLPSKLWSLFNISTIWNSPTNHILYSRHRKQPRLVSLHRQLSLLQLFLPKHRPRKNPNLQTRPFSFFDENGILQ
jgi:hypothetical protein